MFKTTTLRFQSVVYWASLVILAAFLGLFIAGANYDWQGLLLVAGALGILSIFLLPRLARVEHGDFIIKVLIIGLLLKFVFALVNYYFALSVYGGTADAFGYDRIGTIIAQNIRHFEFNKVVPYLQWGTDFINFFTGVVYSIIGPSIFGGFLVYAFLSFLGSYYFYRAFKLAFPEGNKSLFLLLIFFLPSILFWPSAIGKDAPMFLCLGLFAYGAAQLTRGGWRGLIPLALGLLGAFWIRPHIAAISILAFALAFFLPGARKRPLSPAVYIIGLIAVGGLAWFVMPRVMGFLGLQGLSPNELLAYLQQSQVNTDVGTSTFQAVNINNPLNLLLSPVTILFRPFPWEADNIQALVESLQSIFILGLVLWKIKSLGRAIGSSISNIFSRYILIYMIIFVIIFVAITNFGTLARERVMLYPFLFMLISYSPLRLTEKRKIVTGNAGELDVTHA